MSNLPKLKGRATFVPGPATSALPRLRPSLGLIPEAAPWPTRAQREERLFEDSSRSLEFAAPTPARSPTDSPSGT